jgi:uncharacterized membrane protein
MKPLSTAWTDDWVQQFIGRLLRWGVLLSAAVVIVGASAYLVRYGTTRPDYSRFHGESPALQSVTGILKGVAHGSSYAWIQLGLLLLIATPVVRVAFSIFAFIVERDLLYVGVTLVVFVVLIYSLFLGG